MKNKTIAILSTVINFDLYRKTSALYPKDIQKYVIDGRKGMFGFDSLNYFFNLSKHMNIKYLILSDEDVIFTDFSVVFDIIEYMKNNNIHVAGPRDGGSISHRNENPHLMNTFFNILDYDEIKTNWNKKVILSNQYINHNEFVDDFSELQFKYNEMSLYEPYYCFYLWLKRKKLNFYFIEGQMHTDKISNHLIFNHQIFLTHTWYARSYGNNEKHTKRIDEILLKKNLQVNKSVDFELHKDQLFALKHKIILLKKQSKNWLKKIFFYKFAVKFM